VVEGVWERSPEEFIRRVEPEDMRSSLGRRSLRVPAGTAGFVLVDGVVEETLLPGLRTTVGFFENIANFFSSRDRRTAFYLVDLRPIPVPFSVQTHASAEGQVIQTQVVVTFSLQKGNRNGVATFVANVLGSREAYAANDLYDLLRPEVNRRARQVIERLSSQGTLDYAQAEAELRKTLSEDLGQTYGLNISVSVAPLTAILSLDFHLGRGQTPNVRKCTDCGVELPATLKFCDACGVRQPTLLTPDRSCTGCNANVALSDEFCTECGKAYTPPPAEATALYSSDGIALELDLVLRVQGQHEGFSTKRLAPALVGAVAAQVREATFETLSNPGAFASIEEAIEGDLTLALSSFGMRLVAVSVVDLRSKTSQWLLGARADLEHAKQEVLTGREWLAQRHDELDLEALTFGLRLQQQKIERDGQLELLKEQREAERREARLELDRQYGAETDQLSDRDRRQTLEERAAALDISDAKRQSQRAIELDSAERAKQRHLDEAEHGDVLVGLGRDAEVEQAERERRQRGEVDELEHDIQREARTFEHESTLTRQTLGLEAEKARQNQTLDAEKVVTGARARAEADTLANDAAFRDVERRKRLDRELADLEENKQVEKLRAMAQIDLEMAHQDQEHQARMRESLKGLSEREMIAAQATELAKTEGGGAAWAAALAAQQAADVEALRLADSQAHSDETRALMERQQAQLIEVMQRELERAQQLTHASLGAADKRAEEAAKAHSQASAQALEMGVRGMDAVANAGGQAHQVSGQVYDRSMDAMSRVAASKAAPSAVAINTDGGGDKVLCTNPKCDNLLRAGARFCGACGTSQ